MPLASRLSMALGLMLLAGCDSGSATPSTGLPSGSAMFRPPPSAADRSRADALVLGGLKSSSAGQYEDAREALKKAIELVPDHRDALFHFAEASQLLAGQLTDAKDAARVETLHAEAVQALVRIRSTYKMLRPDESASLAVGLYLQARQLAHAGNGDAAVERLTAAFAAGPVDPAALDADAAFASLRESSPAFAAFRKNLDSLIANRARDTIRARLEEHHTYPLEITGRDLKGNPKSLASAAGKALTVVNLWGTWCGPCTAEIPHFIRLQDEFRDRGVAVVGLAFERDDLENPGAVVERFLEDHKVNYPSMLGDLLTQRSIPGFSKFPSTLFLDPSGNVRLMLPGYQSYPDLAAAVEALLPVSP